jgi:hypothetical protein
MVESGAHRGLTARATTDQPRLSLVGFLRHHAQTQFRQISARSDEPRLAARSKVDVRRARATTDSAPRVSQRIGAMIPVRVSHNPSIGPGVVPAGVDPAYDAQYANHKGPTAHIGANGHGRPFSVAPGPITHTQ